MSTQTTEQYFDSLISNPEYKGAYYHSFNIKLSGNNDGTILGGSVLDYLSTHGIQLTPKQFEQFKIKLQCDMEMATFRFLSLIRLEDEVKRYLEEEEKK
jgi:hypothetical protein